MANDLDEAKAARDAVLSRKLVVQIGTQHRSEPYQAAVRDLIATGALGHISKVEIVWNYHGPRWRGTAGSPADPRGRHGLAQMAADQALPSLRPARLFRVPALPRFLQRNSRSVDEPRHRHGSPLHGRPLPTFGRGPRRRFRLARRARESGHVPGAAGLPEGFPGQLFDQLRQRFRQLHAHHGRQRNAGQHRRRRQPALETGGGKGHARTQPVRPPRGRGRSS